MSYHRYSSAVLGIFLVTLVAVPQTATSADDDTKNDFIIPPQLERELGPEVLNVLKEERQRHTNEAFVVVPLIDTTGLLTTFGDVTALLRLEKDNAGSISVFRGTTLIQTGDTALDFDEAAGAVDIRATIEDVHTGDKLVNKVRVTLDPLQHDRCSIIIDAQTTVVRGNAKRGGESKPNVISQTVFDICRRVVEKSATDGALPDEVIEQFDSGIYRAMVRLALEDIEIQLSGLDDLGLVRPPLGVDTARCVDICFLCALTRNPAICRECARCILRG